MDWGNCERDTGLGIDGRYCRRCFDGPARAYRFATCQQELGDAKGARSTYENIASKYPDSTAAATAKQRLKK